MCCLWCQRLMTYIVKMRDYVWGNQANRQSLLMTRNYIYGYPIENTFMLQWWDLYIGRHDLYDNSIHNFAYLTIFVSSFVIKTTIDWCKTTCNLHMIHSILHMVSYNRYGVIELNILIFYQICKRNKCIYSTYFYLSLKICDMIS